MSKDLLKGVVKILKIVDSGEGLVQDKGKYLLVPYVLEGEEVLIEKKGKKIELIEVTDSSKERVTPICKHFMLCGGCSWQHMKYEEQLRIKNNLLKNNFKHHLDFEITNTIIFADPLYYRNKMEFSFGTNFKTLHSQKEKALGMHPKGVYFKVFELEECFLQNKETIAIINYLQHITEHLSYYDNKQQTGLLKSVLIRQIQDNFMIMITLSEYSTEITLIFEKLMKKFPNITSYYYGINSSLNTSMYNTQSYFYSGQEYLEEKLGNISFLVGPKSFFQPNKLLNTELCEIVKKFVNQQPLLDLYCGVGTLGIYAGSVVLGIEENAEAIHLAKKNALKNNITADYIEAKVENSIPLLTQYKIEAIVVDPPREGLKKEVINFLKEAEITTLVYVSCHPSTLIRDLKELLSHYTLKEILGVDQFPQTPHLEVVAHLIKK